MCSFDVDIFRDFVHDEESKTKIEESTGFAIPMNDKAIQRLSQALCVFLCVCVCVCVCVCFIYVLFIF